MKTTNPANNSAVKQDLQALEERLDYTAPLQFRLGLLTGGDVVQHLPGRHRETRTLQQIVVDVRV